MGNPDLILPLIETVYDAVLEPQRWNVFLSGLADALGGRSAFLRLVDWESGQARFMGSVGYDPAFLTAYRQYFIRIDHYRKAFENAPSGIVLPDSEVQGITLNERRKTEYHNDFERPQDIMHVMGGCLMRHGPWQLQLASQRGKSAGPFGNDEKKILSALVPHVVRAFNIQQLTASQSHEHATTKTVLDKLRVGVILTDEHGRPHFLNRSAEQLAMGTPGFVVRKSGIALPSAAQTSELAHYIRDAAKQPGERNFSGGDLRVMLCDGQFLQIKVIPLPIEQSQIVPAFAAASKVAVFVCKPETPVISGQSIERLYGLSRAEARLVAKLAAGLTIDEASEHLGITSHTARSQLKSIFMRTGTHRQAELIMKLLGGLVTQYLGDGE